MKTKKVLINKLQICHSLMYICVYICTDVQTYVCYTCARFPLIHFNTKMSKYLLSSYVVSFIFFKNSLASRNYTFTDGGILKALNATFLYKYVCMYVWRHVYTKEVYLFLIWKQIILHTQIDCTTDNQSLTIFSLCLCPNRIIGTLRVTQCL